MGTHKSLTSFCRFSLLLAGGLLAGGDARAIVFAEPTAGSTFNTSAPTADLAGSGWQWQGKWGTVLGTPIAPNLFITAKHVGGKIGQLFTYTDPATATTFQYKTVAKYTTTSRDLNIWKVESTTLFPTWAPLYTDTDEIGKDLVVFGRSAPRGSAINVTIPGETSLRGWKVGGAGAGTQRWGENTVAGVASYSNVGELLYFNFDRGTGNPNEASLAPLDSSGGVFIQDSDDGLWKLAGLNYGIDGPFNTTNSGSGYSAVLVDAGGLYVGPSSSWTYIPDTATDISSSSYATRLSSNISWIQGIINANAPVGGWSAFDRGFDLDTAGSSDVDVEPNGFNFEAVPESGASGAVLVAAFGLAGYWRRLRRQRAERAQA